MTNAQLGFFWLLDCIYSSLHLHASRGNCNKISPANAEFFADCSLTMSSVISLGLSYVCCKYPTYTIPYISITHALSVPCNPSIWLRAVLVRSCSISTMASDCESPSPNCIPTICPRTQGACPLSVHSPLIG